MEKTRYRKIYYSQYLIVVLALVIVTGLALLGHWAMKQISYEDQFVIPWAAGRSWLLEGIDPYDDQVIQLARTTLNDVDFRGRLPGAAEFDAPFLNLVFSLPLSLLPYEIARTIWVSLLGLSLAASGFMLLKLSQWKTSSVEKIAIIILLMGWLPALQLVLKGSLIPIILLLILSGIYAILQGKDTLAGFLLALTFASVQSTFLILILFIVWSLFHKRWSVLVAYFSGLAFLWVISLIVLRSWPLSWLAVLLRNYSDFSWIHTPLMDLAGLLPGISNYLSIALHGFFGIYLLVIWIASLRPTVKNNAWYFLAIINIAFLFQVENAGNTLLLTLPALFFVFRYWSEKWGLLGRVVSWLILLAVCVIPWFTAEIPSVFAGNVAFKGWIIGLPILAAVGMSLVRWWALKTPNMAYSDLTKY